MSNIPTRIARLYSRCFVSLCLLVAGLTARGELSASWPDQQDLTAESLVHCFADFKFELNDRLQDPETFLRRKSGDCDDFASLVSNVLNRRGYKTKLVVIMMERETHVVCYVPERKAYLDYNLRAAAQPLVLSDGSLEDIAQKVATYFRSKWRMASEIRYEGATPVFLYSTFPQVPTKAPVAANTEESASTAVAKASPPHPAAPLGVIQLAH